jgi:hypothetical protein
MPLAMQVAAMLLMELFWTYARTIIRQIGQRQWHSVVGLCLMCHSQTRVAVHVL